jgi:hypothetical protein
MKSSLARREAAGKTHFYKARWLVFTAIASVIALILFLAKSCPKTDVMRSNDTVRIKA